MTQAQTIAFFERYRDAFNALDGDAVADLWAVPCTIADARGLTHWAEDAPMRANMQALCGVYAQAGYARAEFALEHHEPLGAVHDFALVRWRITRADGTLLQAFGTAYQLVTTPAGPRVQACTAFEEDLKEMTRHAAP